MKWLLIALLVLIGSVAVALVALPDPGYVLIGYGNYSVETSLLVLLTVLVLAYLGVRALAGLWHVPGHLQHWGRRRHDLRLQAWYDDATRSLSEGQAERAERRLARLLRSPQVPLQAYLAAAQAAGQLGADQRRDRYLQLALQRQPKSESSILIQQAELQLAASQADQAQTTLTRLQNLLPHNSRVLRLLMQLYLQQEDWPRLRDLLPDLRRNHVLDQSRWHKLALQVYREQILALSRAAEVRGLNDGWRQLPSAVQQDPGLLAVYTEQLIRLGEHGQAGRLLREQLSQDWNPRFVYLFGELREQDPVAQQAQAEHWLERYPLDAVLLLTLGKICLRNQLWGKARSYLQDSIRSQPSAEAYRHLANLLEQLDEPEAAVECFRKGLALGNAAQPSTALTVSGADAEFSAGDVSRSA